MALEKEDLLAGTALPATGWQCWTTKKLSIYEETKLIPSFRDASSFGSVAF